MAEEAMKNKLAAKIIKAEMLNDHETVRKLKTELANLAPKETVHHPKPIKEEQTNQPKCQYRREPRLKDHINDRHDFITALGQRGDYRRLPDNRVKRFIESTNSLSSMFVQEKNSTASDEAKMFVENSAKFSRDDMETKYFSQEIDDSQSILNKPKRHKQDSVDGSSRGLAFYDPTKMEQESCDRCIDRQANHLIVERQEYVYMSLMNAKPALSSMSNVIIRNSDHSCGSFVSSSDDHQLAVENLIGSLFEAWKSRGYRMIIMETYFKNRRPSTAEFVSCGKHFQIHCLPIKEKHYERARMSFKQSLLSSGKEWSMNKKLIQTDERRIQRYLPKGLSYFWVCFDNLKNGFAHVIESEQEFSRFFGLEVLAGLLDKDFNPMKLDQKEQFKEQFERSREFKLLYSKFR